MSEPVIALCASADLQEGGLAVPFDVQYGGQTCRAFAIRYQGVAHAYLNRCTHVAMEMDYQPNRFFDDSGKMVVVCNPRCCVRARYGVVRWRPVPWRFGENSPIGKR